MRNAAGLILLPVLALALGARPSPAGPTATPIASLAATLFRPALNKASNVSTSPVAFVAPQRGQGSRRTQPVQRTPGRRGTGPSNDGKDPASTTSVIPDNVDDFQLKQWFANCDLDGNRWLSFYETKRTMDFSKDIFRSFDRDTDGRLVRAEFDAYHEYASKRGQFRRPRRLTKPTPPDRTAEQLLLAYDSDLNGGISQSEAARLLRDYSSIDLDVESLFPRVDRDQSKLLDVDELDTLGIAIKRLNVPRAPKQGPTGDITVDTLFFRLVPTQGRTAPNRFEGPITPFRRLDYDGDGNISNDDLQDLQISTLRGLRPSTILHTLDKNKDGVLDREEFRSALEPDVR